MTKIQLLMQEEAGIVVTNVHPVWANIQLHVSKDQFAYEISAVVERMIHVCLEADMFCLIVWTLEPKNHIYCQSIIRVTLYCKAWALKGLIILEPTTKWIQLLGSLTFFLGHIF